MKIRTQKEYICFKVMQVFCVPVRLSFGWKRRLKSYFYQWNNGKFRLDCFQFK